MCRDLIIGKGSAVLETGVFFPDFESKFAEDAGKKWYRSKERKGGVNPFPSYMMNKKWTMEEEFNNHVLRFNQVSVNFSIFY